jgi:TonB family protein
VFCEKNVIMHPIFMKSIFILILNITISNLLFAQIKVVDSNCICTHKSELRNPDNPNEISGTVIVEFDMDSLGLFSNAKVIQSLGKSFDNEVLRVINEQIFFLNRCRKKCFTIKKQIPKKLKQAITFVNPADD